MITDLIGGLINCETKKDALDLLTILDEMGWKWFTYKVLLDETLNLCWEYYSENTCYNLNEADKTVTYSSKGYNIGKTITNFKDIKEILLQKKCLKPNKKCYDLQILGEAVVKGQMMLTDEEAELIERVTNPENWENMIDEPYSPEFYIELKENQR